MKRELNVEIKPAPDEWDRLYNVDFYIKIGEKYIGLRIKPITYEQAPEIYKWKDWLRRSHEKFEKDFGGKVFVIFSIKDGNRKKIHNPEVIEEIREEIKRLESEST